MTPTPPYALLVVCLILLIGCAGSVPLVDLDAARIPAQTWVRVSDADGDVFYSHVCRGTLADQVCEEVVNAEVSFSSGAALELPIIGSVKLSLHGTSELSTGRATLLFRPSVSAWSWSICADTAGDDCR